jgi:2-polyprenyl-3-methyl-5-hydroxy-6-metoxy-1,4-benzoquinol methylase
VNTTTFQPDSTEATRRDALVDRLYKATIASFELLHVYLGERLGLYRSLSSLGPATAADLAGTAVISERSAREWLEEQAVAGILDVVGGDGDERQYRLSAEHAQVLVDRDALSYMTPLALGVAGLAQALPAVLEAFRTGGGVAYERYGPDVRESISWLNRPMFLQQLGRDWLPAVAGLDARLRADPPARVADVGCGTGWSSIAIALAYPNATVEGIDLDDASIAEARSNAEQAGVAGRVTFEVRDAGDPQLAGRYDLVCAFETIHDMTDPVAALRAMRTLQGEAGVTIVADERVAETFTAPGDDLERFMYGWSALHCLPVGMVAAPATGTGTVMRTSTLRRYAQEAGFRDVEVLPIENDFWRFYRLHDCEVKGRRTE